MSPECFALITDERGERVLMLALPDGWSLPHLSVTEPFWWQDVLSVNRAAEEQLGVRCTTSCCFRILYPDPPPGTPRRIFVMTPQDWLPLYALVNSRWVAPGELRTLELSWPEIDTVVTEWFESPPPRVPWYRRGWQGEPFAWLRSRLAHAQMPTVGAPTQLRTWERSSVWRFETEVGPAYFKAVGPSCQIEPALSTQLSRWVPERVAEVIAAAPERGWLLLRDGGLNLLAASRDGQDWEAAVRQYGETQVELVARAEELSRLGVPSRPIERLPKRAHALLNDGRALARGSGRLSADELARLHKLVPGLELACDELTKSPIPASLEHGDLTAGQFLTKRPLTPATDAAARSSPATNPPAPEPRYRIIDWSDSSVTFPFLSMLFFWAELGDSFDDPDAVRQRLRDAYLSPWSHLAAQSELERLYQLAMQVAPWHYAVNYHEAILPRMSVGWEMENMLPYYLRLALAR